MLPPRSASYSKYLAWTSGSCGRPPRDQLPFGLVIHCSRDCYSHKLLVPLALMYLVCQWTLAAPAETAWHVVGWASSLARKSRVSRSQRLEVSLKIFLRDCPMPPQSANTCWHHGLGTTAKVGSVECWSVLACGLEPKYPHLASTPSCCATHRK